MLVARALLGDDAFDILADDCECASCRADRATIHHTMTIGELKRYMHDVVNKPTTAQHDGECVFRAIELLEALGLDSDTIVDVETL